MDKTQQQLQIYFIYLSNLFQSLHFDVLTQLFLFLSIVNDEGVGGHQQQHSRDVGFPDTRKQVVPWYHQPQMICEAANTVNNCYITSLRNNKIRLLSMTCFRTAASRKIDPITNVHRYQYLKLNRYVQYYYIRGLMKSLVTAKLLQKTKKTKIQDTIQHILIGNGDPMHKVYISHRIPHAWKQSR